MAKSGLVHSAESVSYKARLLDNALNRPSLFYAVQTVIDIPEGEFSLLIGELLTSITNSEKTFDDWLSSRPRTVGLRGEAQRKLADLSDLEVTSILALICGSGYVGEYYGTQVAYMAGQYDESREIRKLWKRLESPYKAAAQSAKKRSRQTPEKIVRDLGIVLRWMQLYEEGYTGINRVIEQELAQKGTPLKAGTIKAITADMRANMGLKKACGGKLAR